MEEAKGLCSEAELTSVVVSEAVEARVGVRKSCVVESASSSTRGVDGKEKNVHRHRAHPPLSPRQEESQVQ